MEREIRYVRISRTMLPDDHCAIPRKLKITDLEGGTRRLAGCCNLV